VSMLYNHDVPSNAELNQILKKPVAIINLHSISYAYTRLVKGYGLFLLLFMWEQLIMNKTGKWEQLLVILSLHMLIMT
jgi:hypothetical protein